MAILAAIAVLVAAGLMLMLEASKRRALLYFVILPIAAAVAGYVGYCTLSDDPDCW